MMYGTTCNTHYLECVKNISKKFSFFLEENILTDLRV